MNLPRPSEGASRDRLSPSAPYPEPGGSGTSVTRTFHVAGAVGRVTVSGPSWGAPGRVDVAMAKHGSTLAGLLEGLSATLTRGLQMGVPLEVFLRDYIGTRFDPAGQTDDPDIPYATSVLDYLGRRLAMDYLTPEACDELGVRGDADTPHRGVLAGGPQ